MIRNRNTSEQMQKDETCF